jgi:integrase
VISSFYLRWKTPFLSPSPKGRLRIHDLRHTLGRRLRKDLGVPLETIMGILRHADIRETLVYAPYSIEEGRAAMSKLDEQMNVPVQPSGLSPVAVPAPAMTIEACRQNIPLAD